MTKLSIRTDFKERHGSAVRRQSSRVGVLPRKAGRELTTYPAPLYYTIVSRTSVPPLATSEPSASCPRSHSLYSPLPFPFSLSGIQLRSCPRCNSLGTSASRSVSMTSRTQPGASSCSSARFWSSLSHRTTEYGLILGSRQTCLTVEPVLALQNAAHKTAKCPKINMFKLIAKVVHLVSLWR